jgi:hypothetical protein
LSSTNKTPVNSAVVPLGTFFHFWPPSRVLRTVPPDPTAHPVRGFRKYTFINVTSVPDFCTAKERGDSPATVGCPDRMEIRAAKVKTPKRRVATSNCRPQPLMLAHIIHDGSVPFPALPHSMGEEKVGAYVEAARGEPARWYAARQYASLS